MSVIAPKEKETLFDAGYRHGLLWGKEIGEAMPNSWSAKAQYKAGVQLGQQENRKRQLQQLVMLDPS